MNKLTHGEAMRIIAVLDESLGQLQLLSYLPVGEEPGDRFGDDISAESGRLLSQQARLEARLAELLAREDDVLLAVKDGAEGGEAVEECMLRVRENTKQLYRALKEDAVLVATIMGLDGRAEEAGSGAPSAGGDSVTGAAASGGSTAAAASSPAGVPSSAAEAAAAGSSGGDDESALPASSLFPRSDGCLELLRRLRQLRKMMVTRLSTTVEQEQSQTEFTNDLRARIKQAELDRIKLQEELRKERLEKERDLTIHNDIISKLKAELHDIKQTSEVEAATLERETKEKGSADRSEHVAEYDRLEERLGKTDESVETLVKADADAEELLRNRTRKAELGVTSWISKYDEFMLARAETMAEVESAYAHEKRRLAELEEHFRRIDRDLAIEAEEEAAIAAIAAKKRAEEMRLHAAASTIQTAWRGFVARRKVKEMKKRGSRKKKKKGKRRKKGKRKRKR
eukprot:PLAT11866.1.p1 GENE.PLAT11866.1~~PLAT11866.1.p1  ORF type:complete len:456 (-),score=243.25 PLAT11866.1:129-1496(-)